jgi:hypothetical protein
LPAKWPLVLAQRADHRGQRQLLESNDLLQGFIVFVFDTAVSTRRDSFHACGLSVPRPPATGLLRRFRHFRRRLKRPATESGNCLILKMADAQAQAASIDESKVDELAAFESGRGMNSGGASDNRPCTRRLDALV